MNLRLDWCSYQAAKYAVEHWHYSKSISAAKRAQIGVWENDIFKGVIVFGLGAHSHLGTMFGLTMFECSELTRVALSDSRESSTSKIVALAIKMFHRQSPGVRLLVSYADCDREHIGIIYQATNWTYLGVVQTNGGTPRFLVNGKTLHGRQVHSLWGKGAQRLEWLRENKDPNAEKVYTEGKHKYAYPLDNAMREQIALLAKPYPKKSDLPTTEGSNLATS